jgi:hypothetical protein
MMSGLVKNYRGAGVGVEEGQIVLERRQEGSSKEINE